MKRERQSQILKIIQENPISTHEQLMYELKKSGFSTTQATVSRDIKALGIIKIPSKDGVGIYAVRDHVPQPPVVNRLSDSVQSVKCALHTIVVKTYPGMASAVAATIDSAHGKEFLGSIAGDDTILIIAGDQEKAQLLAAVLVQELNKNKEW